MMMKKKAFPYAVIDMYNEMIQRKLKFAGIYQTARSMLFISDPHIIKDVTVTYFDHFVNRRPFVQKGVDELLSRSLLSLQDNEWRDMRHALSPAFTGAKLRAMLPFMEESCKQLTKYLRSRKNPEEALNVHEVARRFAADVISTTAYGVSSDSLNNENSQFYDQGIKLMDMSGLRALVMFGYLISPALMKILKIPFTPKELSEFFTQSIFGTIKFREMNNKTRADMIQLMLDARAQNQNKSSGMSDIDIAAQAFAFFIGGFDTIAVAMCFTVQLLAMHPEVQEKVRKEVDETLEKDNGTLTYDTLQHGLPYMDMVISEVLRMYPPAPMIDRMCSKGFEMPEHNLKLDTGTSIGVPIMGLHYNPEYFPDPERFDPERFSKENITNIQPFTYLPFGAGPRNCIGMRFAQMETKLVLSHIVSAVNLEVCEKTAIPIVLSKTTTLMKPEEGFWIKATPRNNSP